MAGQQPLRRLGLDNELVARLASEGLHTAGDIFSKTELQLVQSLDIGRSQVVAVMDHVARKIVPEQKTAAELLRERRESGVSLFVATGLPTIDGALQVVQQRLDVLTHKYSPHKLCTTGWILYADFAHIHVLTRCDSWASACWRTSIQLSSIGPM